MAEKKVYFLSDLHLGAKYYDNPREKELHAVRFLDSIAADAAALYLLGDVLDYWYEYRNVVPRGYIRFFAAIARLTDAGIPVYWLTGNHDVWLFDYLSNEIGVTVLHRNGVHEIMGQQVFLSHGDDVGHQPIMYRFMRWCFYNRACQWLYALVHPRWTYVIAHGWSTSNRTHRKPNDVSREIEVAYGHLTKWVAEHSSQHPTIAHYIMGHLHTARQAQIGNATLTILGDWITLNTYATFDGKKVELHSFE